MRDFVTACKILKSGKTRKVVDLAKKWNPNFSTDGGKNQQDEPSKDEQISFKEDTRQFNSNPENSGGSQYT